MSKIHRVMAAAVAAPERDLEVENRLLRRQLKALLAEARQNESKLRRFQALELRLIECASLFELLQTVLYEYRAMARHDRVALLLYDPECELRRLLEEEGLRLEDFPDLLFADHRGAVNAHFNASLNAYLGPHRADRHAPMFSDRIHPPASIALLPMVRRGEAIGSLNLGSYRSERFVDGVASDFLQRLAAIVAVCLENVINRERLRRVGLTDVLTGVNNRRFFDQRLLEEVADARRAKAPLSCLFLDVDRFKQVNDGYGHLAGDRVLKEVAALIRRNLRTSDVLARYGGEEFAALLSNTGRDEAVEIAERIRTGIEQAAFILEDGRQVRVTISIGAATVAPAERPQAIETLGMALVGRADRRVLEAKQNGRNQVVFDPAE